MSKTETKVTKATNASVNKAVKKWTPIFEKIEEKYSVQNYKFNKEQKIKMALKFNEIQSHYNDQIIRLDVVDDDSHQLAVDKRRNLDMFAQYCIIDLFETSLGIEKINAIFQLGYKWYE